MRQKRVPFDEADVQVLTLVYAVRDGEILVLERAATKAFLPGWMVGVGGKVEPGETVFDAAAREFEEETGLRAAALELRGSYTFITDTQSNRCGVIYLFVTTDVQGDFVADVPDGTLRWMTVDALLASDKVMEDHKLWIGRIFDDPSHFACVGSWCAPEGGKGPNEASEWADSLGYFERRKAAA